MGSRQVIADLTSKIMEQSDGDEQHIDNGISNGKEDAEEEIEEDSYSIEQFDIVKTIGRGGFARVCLCLHKPTSQYFALKTLPSQETTKLKKIEHVNCEKEILQDIQHPTLPPFSVHNWRKTRHLSQEIQKVLFSNCLILLRGDCQCSCLPPFFQYSPQRPQTQKHPP